MGFSFVGATLYDLWHLNKNKGELKEVLSLHQTITALIDIVASVALAVLATLILTHIIHCSPTIAYSLLGGSAFCIINGFIAFAIQTYKKFKHNTQKSSQKDSELDSEKKQKEIQKKEMEESLLNAQTKWNQNLSALKEQCHQKDLELDSEKQKSADKMKELEIQNQKLNEAMLEQISLNEQLKRLQQVRECKRNMNEIELKPPTNKNSIEIEEFKEEDQITIEVIEDKNSKCPYINYQEKRLCIAFGHKKLMENDSYFKNFVPGSKFSGKMPAALIEGFLLNLKLYFKNDKLFQQQEKTTRINPKHLARDVKYCLEGCKDFFEEMALTNDICFVKSNFDGVNKAINKLLDALLHAFEMDNEALMMFWLKALETRFDIPTLISAFDQFNERNFPVALLPSLHEVIFEYLANHLDSDATKEFIQKYKDQKILKIGTLNLRLVSNNKTILNKISELLVLIDWDGVKTLNYEDIEAHSNTAFCEFVFKNCKEPIFQLLGNPSVPRVYFNIKTMVHLYSNIFDMSHDNPSLSRKNEWVYKYNALELQKTHLYFEKVFPQKGGASFLKIQIFYKSGSEERLKDYLRNYYHIYCDEIKPCDVNIKN